MCFGAPPQVTHQPRVPAFPVSTSCAASALEPATDAGNDTAPALMLGRWERCSATPVLPPVDFEGLEFYANGLFSTLQRMPDGGHEQTPDAGRGSYKAYTPFQIGLTWEGIGTVFFHPKFSPGRDTMETWYQNPADLKMARLPPDPNASTALPPSKLQEGRCPLFGVWDTTVTSDNSRSTILFGNDGQFIGSPVTANACLAPTFWGVFWIETDTLTLANGEGFAPCDRSFETTWTLSFSADCQTMSASSRFDNCTGGRPFLTNQMTLRRR